MSATYPSRIVLLGHPVAHSLSARFQNAAIRAAGLSSRYEALDVTDDALEGCVAGLRREGVAGNVTIPHKRRVFALCERVTHAAQRTGAVNTFWFADGALHGDNTDVVGFDLAVRALLGREPRNEKVALIGAGGSASAVLMAIESWGNSRARVWSRNAESVWRITAQYAAVAEEGAGIRDVLHGATLVVNATPAGMRDDSLAVDPDLLPAGAAVFDLVYGARETALVRAARERGHTACDGRTMLLEQGALAFMRWFDVAPDKMVMRRALDDALSGA